MSYRVSELVDCYQCDDRSSFQTLSHQTRIERERVLARIKRKHGNNHLRQIGPTTLARWRATWEANGRIAGAYKVIVALREAVRFGVFVLDDRDCKRLLSALLDMRLESSGTRSTRMTEPEAIAVRNMARRIGYFSIALAQALQFELRLSQKDVIGEWVPVDDPQVSNVTLGKYKWVRGIRWPQIDESLILHRHGAPPIDLAASPMVMEEFRHVPDWQHDFGGPVIVCEHTSYPWQAPDFRRRWRSLADLCEVPRDTRNTDV
jgi:hypothetical protein